MIELVVRHLVVLGIAWLFAWFLRKRSAALRHALWATALIVCVLLPLLQRIPLVVPTQLASPIDMRWPGMNWVSQETQLVRGASVAPADPSFEWTTLGWCIYAAVALVIALRWVIGLRQAFGLTRHGQPAGMVRGIRVVIADGTGPLTFGWPRAVIIIPHKDMMRNELVLGHELAHAQRADFLWQALGTLACALWWFSPAVWFAHRALRREAEHACDDCVLAAGSSAVDYADGLLEVATMKSRALWNPVLVPMLGGADLGRRIAAVLAPARDRRAVRPWTIAGLVLLLLPAALFISRPLVAADAGISRFLAGKKIVLDPGHGGRDPGATAGGLRESDVTLAIAQRTKVLLEQAGAKVTLTRERDEFVELRHRVARSAEQDLFLSVHVESTSRPSAEERSTSLRIYFDDDNAAGGVRAFNLAVGWAGDTGMPDGTDGSDGRIRKASFVVLRHAKSPALLIEVANMNSEEDRARLRDPKVLDSLARRLADGAAAVLKGDALQGL